MHAGNIASSDAKTSAIADDIEEYKKFITGTHQSIDGYVKDRFTKVEDAHKLLIAQLESLAAVVTPRVETVEERIRALDNLGTFKPVPPSPVPEERAGPTVATEVPAGYGGLGHPAPAVSNVSQNAGQAAPPLAAHVDHFHISTCLLYTSPSPRDRG